MDTQQASEPTRAAVLTREPGNPRDARSLAWPIGVGAAAALTGAALHATGGASAFPACPLHAVTGLWCPFCGGTRAVLALTRGDVAAALSANLVLTVLMPVVVAGWLLFVRRVWCGAEPLDAVPRLPRPVVAALVTVLVVFTLWRNLPAVPLAHWLAP